MELDATTPPSMPPPEPDAEFATMVQWYAGCEFTVDIDDLVAWHK